MKIRTWFLLILLMLSACGFNPDRDPIIEVNGELNKVLTTSLSWNDIQKIVFQPKCISCHSGGRIGDYRNYEVVLANLSLIEKRALKDKDMPRPPDSLTSEQARSLAEWIAAGGPREGSAGGPIPTPTPEPVQEEVVLWASLKEQVIQPKCLGCHGPNNFSGISDLSEYESFKATIGTIYYSSVITDSMPPRPEGVAGTDPNPSAISQKEKLIISRWIIDGMKLTKE